MNYLLNWVDAHFLTLDIVPSKYTRNFVLVLYKKWLVLEFSYM